MPLETGTQIGDLDPANPPGDDLLAEADDHIRLLKICLLGSLGAMPALWTIATNDTPIRQANVADNGFIDMIKVNTADEVEIGEAGVTVLISGSLALANDVFMTARNAAADGFINMIKVNLNDEVEIGAPLTINDGLTVGGGLTVGSITIGGNLDFNVANPSILGNDPDGRLVITNQEIGVGPYLHLYGPTHSTRPFDFALGVNTTDLMTFSDNTGIFDFQRAVTVHDEIISVAASPRFILNETDGPTDEKQWSIQGGGGSLFFSTRNDAGATVQDWMQVDRTGGSVTEITMRANLTLPGNKLTVSGGSNDDVELKVTGLVSALNMGFNGTVATSMGFDRIANEIKWTNSFDTLGTTLLMSLSSITSHLEVSGDITAFA